MKDIILLSHILTMAVLAVETRSAQKGTLMVYRPMVCSLYQRPPGIITAIFHRLIPSLSSMVHFNESRFGRADDSSDRQTSTLTRAGERANCSVWAE